MASIHREIAIEARPEAVWEALRDVGAIHQRLAPGFVTDVHLEEGARVVTFGNGMVARELDCRCRRPGSPVSVVWIADLLPHEVAPAIAEMIEQGLAVIKRTLETAERG